MSKQMLILQLCCPQCSALLTDGSRVRLDAYLEDGQREGETSLSAVFGDYSIETDLDIREGEVVEFRCPKCESSLMTPMRCKQCGAPMASLNITVGGYVEFCGRRGCKGHALGGVGDIDQMMSLLNKMFETPYD